MLPSVRAEIDRVVRLLDKSPQLEKAGLEFLGHWAQYVCFMAASTLDRCVVLVLLEYVRTNSNDQIHSFCAKKLNRFQNLRARKIIQIHSDFDPDWGKMIKRFLTEEQRISIGSIVSNRNKIAHGGSVNVSLQRVRHWFEKSRDVIEFLDELVLENN